MVTPEHPNSSKDDAMLPSEKLDKNKLNSLRAAVLGANDGLVSTSSVVMGVAGATTDRHAIVVAGLAALVAGALSMAVGEYVSVSSQSDAEKAYIAEEMRRLKDNPEQELDQLAREYEKLGVARKTALVVARELTAKDVLKSHLQVHFNIDPDQINSPMQAAIASLLSFTVGGLVPFTAVLLAPNQWRIPAVICSVLFALVVTGYLSAMAGNASRTRAVSRVLIGGALAMAVTYYIGKLFGVVTG